MSGFFFRSDCEFQTQNNANRKLTRNGQLEGGSLHESELCMPFLKRQGWRPDEMHCVSNGEWAQGKGDAVDGYLGTFFMIASL